MNMDKLIQVYEDTKIKCTTGHYGNLKNGESFLFAPNSPLFEKQILVKKYETNIDVINEDVLVVTEALAKFEKIDDDILVLNLASNSHAGGGVQYGAMAQEEELFRRSNYFMSLDQQIYPLPETNVIYTPIVLIVKDKFYKDLDKPYYVSMIAAAALQQPKLTKTNTYYGDDRSIMSKTIDNIFKTAYFLNHKNLILGALGCGAYGNPSMEVIELFNESLKKYNGCFKNILFAVYSRKDNNFNLFNKYIKRNF